MADDGYAHIYFHEKDLDIVLEVFQIDRDDADIQEEEDTPGVMCLSFDEAYYGMENERKKLTERKIAYRGYADPAGETDSVVFASADGAEIECNSTIGKDPIAKVYDDGTIDEDDLVRARQYYRLVKQLEETQFGHRQ